MGWQAFVIVGEQIYGKKIIIKHSKKQWQYSHNNKVVWPFMVINAG